MNLNRQRHSIHREMQAGPVAVIVLRKATLLEASSVPWSVVVVVVVVVIVVVVVFVINFICSNSPICPYSPISN